MSTNTESKQNKNDENYSFLQENTVPKKRNTRKKIIKSISITVALAVLFGGVSGAVFYATSNQFSKWHSEELEPISLVETQPVPTGEEISKSTEETEKPSTDKGSQKNKILRDYSKVYTELCKLSSNMRKYTATVYTVENVVSWIDLEETKESYGVIVAEDSENIYVLCNYHVVKDGSNIKLTFFDNHKISANLRNYDIESDIAILEVEKEKVRPSTLSQIKPINMGDSYQVSVGTPIMALGAPNGYVNSMEIGYVTSNRIDEYVIDGKMEIFQTSMLENKNGNGFIINLDGKVLGFITHAYKDGINTENMKFMGISRIKPLLEDLINKKERGYLGIKAQDLTVSDAKKLGVNNGIYINYVEADSPAFHAGIKNGDIVTAINGSTVSSVSNFIAYIREYEPGDKCQLTITRRITQEYSKVSQKVKVVKVELGEVK